MLTGRWAAAGSDLWPFPWPLTQVLAGVDIISKVYQGVFLATYQGETNLYIFVHVNSNLFWGKVCFEGFEGLYIRGKGSQSVIFKGSPVLTMTYL